MAVQQGADVVEGRRGAVQVPGERKRRRSSSAPMTSAATTAPDGELPSPAHLPPSLLHPSSARFGGLRWNRKVAAVWEES
jgi:hypothetical protein